eukprot:tig00020510_g9797.t1
MEQERTPSGAAATKTSPAIAFKESLREMAVAFVQGPPSEKRKLTVRQPAARREPVRQDGAGSLIAKLYITNRHRAPWRHASFAQTRFVSHRAQADARSCAIKLKHIMRPRFQMAWLQRRGDAG